MSASLTLAVNFTLKSLFLVPFLHPQKLLQGQ